MRDKREWAFECDSFKLEYGCSQLSCSSGTILTRKENNLLASIFVTERCIMFMWLGDQKIHHYVYHLIVERKFGNIHILTLLWCLFVR